MCITLTVRERERKIMGLATTVINIVLVFCSLILFVMAIAIRFKLDEKLELLDGYDSGSLPYYLMVIAAMMFGVHLAGINFCYNATYVATRSSKHHIFVGVIMVVIFVFVMGIISQIVIAVHSSKLTSALNDGIYKSMKAYKSDLNNKIKIDRLQMEYECCGAGGYKEWFEIPWANLMYINVDNMEVKRFLKDGDFIKDDAPFSCCDKFNKRACVHHTVRTATDHRGYDAHTLYPMGCVEKMMNYFSSGLLTPTALLLLAVLFLQAIDVAVMRMLQTSIFEAEEMNDPEGASFAYCIKGMGGGGDNTDYFKRKKDKDKTEEDEDGDEGEGKNSGKKGGKKKKKGGDDDDEEDDDADDDDDDDKDDDRTSMQFDSINLSSSSGGGGGGRSGGDDDGGGGGSGGGGGRDDDDDGGSKKSKSEKKREKEDKKKSKEEKKNAKKEKKEAKKKEKEEKKNKKKDKKEAKKEKNKEKKEKKKEKKKAKKEKKDKKKKEKKEKKDKKKKEKKEKKAKKKAEKKKKKEAKKKAKNAKKEAKKKQKAAKKKAKKAKKKKK